MQTQGSCCPLAVTKSSCYFAVQTVLAKDVPIKSAGTYAPIAVQAPVGSLVNAQHSSAVVAGNIETSQRIADRVLEALGNVADLSAPGMDTTKVLVPGGKSPEQRTGHRSTARTRASREHHSPYSEA